MRALQLDHKNGGGRKEMIAIGVQQMYRQYLLKPELAKEKLQVLCANCNSIKRFENKESRRWHADNQDQAN